jgi:hypothetical protein
LNRRLAIDFRVPALDIIDESIDVELHGVPSLLSRECAALATRTPLRQLGAIDATGD